MIPLPGEKIILRGRSAKGDDIPLTYDDVDIVETNEVDKPILAEEWESMRSTQANDEETIPTEEEDTSTSTLKGVDFAKEDVVVMEKPAVEQTKIGTEKPSPEKENTVQSYQVAKGDTLFSISRKFGVSVDSIRHHNQLLSDQISIGQKLKIVQ